MDRLAALRRSIYNAPAAVPTLLCGPQLEQLKSKSSLAHASIRYDATAWTTTETCVLRDPHCGFVLLRAYDMVALLMMTVRSAR
eukprot:6212742-Pleurochrysis_carterae.AAC.1